MKWLKKLQHSIRGLNVAVLRFPLTTIFIVLAALVKMYSIHTEIDMTKLFFTFLVGAFLSTVSQVLYERIFSGTSFRYGLYLGVVILTVGYYFIIRHASTLNSELEIKTFVALFALFIAFIWIPVIKSKVTFNQSFMIAFKAFYISLFFSIVIFAGLAAIIGATDLLIFNLNNKIYLHSANIVFVLIFPIYFLSLNPKYITRMDENNGEDEINRKLETIYAKAKCPKMLQVLLSYIIIPLLAAYTFILLLYIVKNITSSFWENNLLEPLHISYSITMIIVYILCSEIENKLVTFFRRVFPKVLVPIVAFQMVASLFTVYNEGVTFTRYYVILFGLFAITSSVIFSFFPIRKNGRIAPILIGLAFLSIVPPIDAFTVSKNSQMTILEEVLIKNDMLVGNKVIPNNTISDEDKEKIRKSVEYLYFMNYTDELSYLPKDFTLYDHFNTVFGFELYDYGGKFGDYTYVHLTETSPFTISGYDFFIQVEIMNSADQSVELIKDDNKYTLKYNNKVILLMNEQEEEIFVYELRDLVEAFSHYEGSRMITPEEATIIKENEHAKMTLFIQNLSLRKMGEPQVEGGLLYVFIQIKDED